MIGDSLYDARAESGSLVAVHPCKGSARRSDGRDLIASLLLVAVPFVPSSFLFLVVRPGAPSSVLVTSSNALVTGSDGLQPTCDGLHLIASFLGRSEVHLKVPSKSLSTQ